jgi:hypothetical protein
MLGKESMIGARRSFNQEAAAEILSAGDYGENRITVAGKGVCQRAFLPFTEQDQ